MKTIDHFFAALACLSTISTYTIPKYQLNHASLQARAPGPNMDRPVYILFNYNPDEPTTSADGKTQIPSHSVVWIGPSQQEGPMKIEIDSIEDLKRKQIKEIVIRTLDLTNKAPDKATPSLDANKALFKVGITTAQNADFFDIKKGNPKKGGIILNALQQDPEYRVGKTVTNPNSCHNVAQKILDQLPELQDEDKLRANGLDPNTVKADMQNVQRQWQSFDEYARRFWPKLTMKIAGIDYTDGGKAQQFRGNAVCKRQGACELSLDQADPVPDDEPVKYKNELAMGNDDPRLTDDDLDATKTDTLVEDDKAPPAGLYHDEQGKSSITLVKNGGKMMSFSTIGRGAVGALGIAGTIVGAAFVILDFVEHNWVGGAVGAIILGAGIIAAAAVTGPVGWAIAAVSTLFAILPGLFGKVHPAADKTDVKGIIQRKMFGDKDHTGNEQCQKGTNDVPANKDCTALYGAGTLSMSLGMNNFDAIAFLLNFNDGYAMSIPDMAANFYVMDPDKKGDGDDKVAVIDCHNKKSHTVGGIAGSVSGDDPTQCASPEFKINRGLINLASLDAKADAIYDRIIPAPNGDCKLITREGTVEYPDYGISVTGSPSSITCGLTADSKIDDGTELAVGDAPKSTDGDGGAAVVPAPPTAPFAPLKQEDYACIYNTGGSAPFCLPPGTYHKQSGLGFEIKKVDTLTLPSVGGWSLQTHWKKMCMAHERDCPQYNDRNYDVNQDPAKKSDQLTMFKDDMSAMDHNLDGEATFHVTGPGDGPDPVCCLFTEASFGGNVWCMGVGGGDVLPQWKNKAKSVSCHNNAQVWLYADHYGDLGGAKVEGNAEDLKNLPYGKDKDTFSEKVKALWVSKIL